MAFIPAHVTLGGAGAERVTLVLHGILGSAANWRGFVRGLLDGRCGDRERAATWRWVLVDLRGHGDSHGAPDPQTVAACADDLLRLEAELGTPFTRVIGHSFGGKVALELARRSAAVAREVWFLDSPPGTSPEGSAARSEIARVIAALRGLSPDGAALPGRAEIADRLRAAGMSDALAAWMTTNVRGNADAGYRWKFDIDVVEALVNDYFVCDLAPFVASPPASVVLRAVVGGRSDRFDAATREWIARVVRTDVLADAGHWVHVDDPAGLGALLTAR